MAPELLVKKEAWSKDGSEVNDSKVLPEIKEILDTMESVVKIELAPAYLKKILLCFEKEEGRDFLGRLRWTENIGM